MARKTPPTEPLVVILGSTGTGKSDLAVELAVRFNGEVINADAMQMYKGLPIITNKISEKEQRGIPHHLLGNIGLDEETWNVGVFKREASRVIREIRSRGRLPIVVGGTHYYTNNLLFEDSLVDDPPKPDGAEVEPEADSGSRFPILEGPTEDMIKELRKVDPVMAERWHPNDRRKIRRSLEIYLTTGKRASDIYAEQQRRKESKWNSRGPREAHGPLKSLLLWVYSEPEVLKERLNRRVDKMLSNGLLDETAEVYQHLQRRLASGEHVDRTKGIWQSIGFKEFEPYLEGVAQGDQEETALARLKQAGVDDTQTATRQYANYQVRWITRKTLPLLRDEQAMEMLYLLDSTDASRWDEDVLAKGAELTRQFLAGEPLPSAVDVSETARHVLSPRADVGDQRETPCQRTCDVCNTTVLTEERWKMHFGGRRHRRAVRHAKRTALVPRRQVATSIVPLERPSSPEEIGFGPDLNAM